jgi:RNA polymerase sigma-70 factor (ECF subfamily)
MHDDDVELVQRAQEGDKEAYWLLIKPFVGRLLGFICSQIHNRQDAEDLVQQTVLGALESVKTLRDPARFGPWLWGIAWNKVHDWRKDLGHQEIPFSDLISGNGGTSLEYQAAFLAPDADGPPDVELWEEVDSLPPKYAEVIRLRYGAGLSLPQIAEILAVAGPTVNKWLVEARKLLRQRWRTDEDP